MKNKRILFFTSLRNVISTIQGKKKCGFRTKFCMSAWLVGWMSVRLSLCRSVGLVGHSLFLPLNSKAIRIIVIKTKATLARQAYIVRYVKRRQFSSANSQIHISHLIQSEVSLETEGGTRRFPRTLQPCSSFTDFMEHPPTSAHRLAPINSSSIRT